MKPRALAPQRTRDSGESEVVDASVVRVEGGFVLSIGNTSLWVTKETAENLLAALALSLVGRDLVSSRKGSEPGGTGGPSGGALGS